jgi:mono/diheme cytochrome c family protein
LIAHLPLGAGWDPGLKRLQLLSAAALLALLGGCRSDMQNQPKFVPQRGTTFFADGRSVRPQVENTVARGQLHADSYYYTGLVAGATGSDGERDQLPFAATMQVLARGQERFNVYCTPCHSRVGNGNGMIVQRGYKPAGNFHDATRLKQPLSHYFYVMTNGYGAMPDYSAQLTPADRWAVAAYIRALQLSQNATEADVAPGGKVQDLHDVAEQGGYPRNFADEWELPGTAINDVPAAVMPGQTNPANGTAPQLNVRSKNKQAAPALTVPRIVGTKVSTTMH